MSANKDNENTINSVARALETIELLYKSSKELGVSEISKEMNIYKSTVFRTLATLEQYGFVIQNPENNKYGLGAKLYAIATAADTKFILRETVRPFADGVMEKFQETVNVASIDKYSDNFSFMTIYRSEGKDKIIRMNVAMSNSECHCSSLGKSLLAFTTDYEKIAKTINYTYHTKNTITNPKDFIEHLGMVQTKGYAFDNEELEVGLTCVGVPIFNVNNEIILAISISGPTSRMVNKIDEIVAELKKVSKQITLALQ